MPTVMKEAFAIHYALNKLHYYLWNAKFTIRTDHMPLKYLLTSEQKNRKLQAWALNIGSYNCDIEYLKGSDNICADLLSRCYDKNDDITNEQSYEVATLNSNQFTPKEFINVDLEDKQEKQDVPPKMGNLDMNIEQNKDSELHDIKVKMTTNKTDKKLFSKYLLLDDILYYISQVDDEPKLRLCVPKHLQQDVLKQYHDENGHMGIEKTFHTIKEKYYWMNLYKHIIEKIDKCTICKSRNLTQQKASIQLSNTPPFPFACVHLDLQGPFKKTYSGNQYIVSFICAFSGWIESFPVPDKTSESVVNLLFEQLIPRHSCPLSITVDNGKEFDNKNFKESLKYLNIAHIAISPYNARANGIVERSHSTLNNILSKLINDNTDIWDTQINAALSAIRTNVSKSTKRSPFFLLYNRDPILPLDNILKPRQKYLGEEFHKIAIQQQHKNFIHVVKQLNQNKIKEVEKSKLRNKNKEEFKIGDAVYYKRYKKGSKLEKNWDSHYIILDQTTPVSFIIKNQLNGKTNRAHANSLRLAKTTWEIPKNDDKMRKTTLAESMPENSHSSSQDDISSDETIIYDPGNYTPLSKINVPQIITNESEIDDNQSTEQKQAQIYNKINNKRVHRSDTSDSEHIPLAELQKRMRLENRLSNNESEENNKNKRKFKTSSENDSQKEKISKFQKLQEKSSDEISSSMDEENDYSENESENENRQNIFNINPKQKIKPAIRNKVKIKKSRVNDNKEEKLKSILKDIVGIL